MGPYWHENSEEMQHNLKHKDNKSYEVLLEFFISLNLAFKKIQIFSILDDFLLNKTVWY